jgi:hypothetical protein
MKFQVSRTSEYPAENAPCPEAVRETYDATLRIPACCPRALEWVRDGVPHTATADGWLIRTEPRLGWFVYFADLEALVSFAMTHGQCVVTPPRPWCGASIEIYDTYRE